MRVFVVGSFVVACSVKVARLPRAGESLDATAFIAEPGGKGFNLAVACSRLGSRIGGIFAIGRDSFGAIAKSTFQRTGFSQQMLVEHDGSTGAGVGFVDQAGENCLAVSLGANQLLSRSDIERFSADLEQSQIVLATFESPDEAILSAFAIARSQGIRTMLNPSPSRSISRDILAVTSIVVFNKVEAEDFGISIKDDGVQGAEQLLNAGPELVVVTLGENGAVALRRGKAPIWQRAFPVNAVDTIGAGDAFSAGFAVSLVEGASLERALSRAAACGAVATCRFGAFDAFPYRADVDRFLEAQAPMKKSSDHSR